jgi:hypothetical protein
MKMLELTGRLANKPAATSTEWEKPNFAVTAGRMPIAIPTAASTTDCGSRKREASGWLTPTTINRPATTRSTRAVSSIYRKDRYDLTKQNQQRAGHAAAALGRRVRHPGITTRSSFLRPNDPSESRSGEPV